MSETEFNALSPKWQAFALDVNQSVRNMDKTPQIQKIRTEYVTKMTAQELRWQKQDQFKAGFVKVVNGVGFVTYTIGGAVFDYYLGLRTSLNVSGPLINTNPSVDKNEDFY